MSDKIKKGNNDNVEEEAHFFLKEIFDSILDPILIGDLSYNILFANKATQKMFDVKDPVASHLKCYQIMHRLDRPCPTVSPQVYSCPLDRVISTRVPARAIQIVHHELLHTQFFIEVTCWPVFDQTGEIVQVVKTCRDITRQKQDQERLDGLILDLQGALARINRLRGLLPICMYCKKIRNDKGYWQRVEAYIGDHSEAEFTHSLCPECEKNLFNVQKDNKNIKPE